MRDPGHALLAEGERRIDEAMARQDRRVDVAGKVAAAGATIASSSGRSSASGASRQAALCRAVQVSSHRPLVRRLRCLRPLPDRTDRALHGRTAHDDVRRTRRRGLGRTLLRWSLCRRLIAPHVKAGPGARVLVVARGSIGLYVCDIARALGAARSCMSARIPRTANSPAASARPPPRRWNPSGTASTSPSRRTHHYRAPVTGNRGAGPPTGGDQRAGPRAARSGRRHRTHRRPTETCGA
jgi:hypothetical protein